MNYPLEIVITWPGCWRTRTFSIQGAPERMTTENWETLLSYLGHQLGVENVSIVQVARKHPNLGDATGQARTWAEVTA